MKECVDVVRTGGNGSRRKYMALLHSTDQRVGLRFALTSTAAVIAEALTFPIDTIKTRLQLQGEGGQAGVKRGTFGMAMNIVKEEGIVGLYRGLSPAVLRHTFYSSIRIVTYEQLRYGLHKGENQHDISAARKALIGGASGMFGQVSEDSFKRAVEILSSFCILLSLLSQFSLACTFILPEFCQWKSFLNRTKMFE